VDLNFKPILVIDVTDIYILLVRVHIGSSDSEHKAHLEYCLGLIEPSHIGPLDARMALQNVLLQGVHQMNLGNWGSADVA